jgi:hypothetical protein
VHGGFLKEFNLQTISTLRESQSLARTKCGRCGETLKMVLMSVEKLPRGDSRATDPDIAFKNQLRD